MKENIEELIENKKYKELKELLKDLNETDIASYLEDVDSKDLVKIFRLIDRDKGAEVFSYLPLSVETELLEELKDNEISLLLEEMYTDDAVDLLEELPTNVIVRLLKQCSVETRNNINKLLKYEDNTAGSIMTVEYASLKENLTVQRAITRLKQEIEEYETVNTCFIIDAGRKLKGSVVLKDLLFAKNSDLVGDICTPCISVKTNTDQEVVANLFKKYDITVMPVVDKDNRLIGIITVDDIVDVMEEETTEDIEKMAAILPTDKPYFETGIFETWAKRIPWLLLLMISATFTGQIITGFEEKLAILPILTAYIPMLMDTGGNAGSQASVTIIRSLSLGDIEFSDILKVIWKELRVSIVIGSTLALANFGKLMLVDKMLLGNEINTSIAIVICLTIFIVVVVAKFIGCCLPLITKKLGFDPAVMASPFITTIVDALGLIVYFEIAIHLISGLM